MSPKSVIAIEHKTVFGAVDTYAGWPANHGAWQRGDSMLVGFMTGEFHEGRGGHNIKPPFTKRQARSIDGGVTWHIEQPNVDFEAATLLDGGPKPWNLTNAIVRCCGIYDTGGEECHQRGGFYLSRDFGRSWEGAYQLPAMDTRGPTDRMNPLWNTSRTAYLADRGLLFLSYALRGFDDSTYCFKVDDLGDMRFLSIVCNDQHRAVMPAVTEVDGRICVALRRRAIRTCWIDLFVSDDDGQTWKFVAEIADTGGHNGNPPALIARGNQLFCAYANRTDKCVYVRTVRMRGDVYEAGEPIVVRGGDCVDIGYPRLFVRADGQLVCVYYWSDGGEPQRIEASIIDA